MSRIRILGILFVIAALLTIPVFVSAQTNQGPITVTLNPQNNSGESGTATLTSVGTNQTKVDVTVTGQPAGVDQPEHIHTGTCANLNPTPTYPLNNLVNGKSSTTVNVSLSTLLASPFAINGHKSATDINTYVYCGEITATSASATATTTTGGAASTAATATPMATATTATTTTLTTPVATSTTTSPSTLPTTGGTSTGFASIILALGLLALGAGVFVWRYAR